MYRLPMEVRNFRVKGFKDDVIHAAMHRTNMRVILEKHKTGNNYTVWLTDLETKQQCHFFFDPEEYSLTLTSFRHMQRFMNRQQAKIESESHAHA